GCRGGHHGGRHTGGSGRCVQYWGWFAGHSQRRACHHWPCHRPKADRFRRIGSEGRYAAYLCRYGTGTSRFGLFAVRESRTGARRRACMAEGHVRTRMTSCVVVGFSPTRAMAKVVSRTFAVAVLGSSLLVSACASSGRGPVPAGTAQPDQF